MIEGLIEAQWGQMFGTSFPRQRFFVPTDGFWEEMNRLKSFFNMIIDCGTGNGELPREAQEHGIRMAGVDVIHRDGNDPTEVQVIPAHRMPYSDKIWALTCRPDHSGWCMALQAQALESGAGFIYVGKHENIYRDVDMDFNLPSNLIHNVGEDSEAMLVWLPA